MFVFFCVECRTNDENDKSEIKTQVIDENEKTFNNNFGFLQIKSRLGKTLSVVRIFFGGVLLVSPFVVTPDCALHRRRHRYEFHQQQKHAKLLFFFFFFFFFDFCPGFVVYFSTRLTHQLEEEEKVVRKSTKSGLRSR